MVLLLLTRAFNLATRALSLLPRGLELVPRGFELVTRRFELGTRISKLVIRLYFSTSLFIFRNFWYFHLIYKVSKYPLSVHYEEVIT